ncbi:MAG: hypothetical protein HKN87_22335 [Saprospiraceae bacterium]|nr:hypothetical protein [Saprospiraceae bacterium]
MRDRLVTGAGFERKNVEDFVLAAKPDQNRLDFKRSKVTVRPVIVELKEKPDLKKIASEIKKKVTWDNKKKTLTITEPLSEEESKNLAEAVVDVNTQKLIAKAALESRTTAIEYFETPAEKGVLACIPQIAINIQGELQLFDDPELLDYPWELSSYDSTPTEEELNKLNASLKVSEGGEIDIVDGRVVPVFMKDLQSDLGLAYKPEHWDETKLATWICKNVPDHSATHKSKQAFVAAWERHLINTDSLDLAKLNQRKFLLRDLVEQRIKDLKKVAINTAYQDTLFGEDSDKNLIVTDEFSFTFSPHLYSPSAYYDPQTSKYGMYDFRHHYYGQIGDFDSREEFECACVLDRHAENGKIKFWIRNPVRKEESSFFLQKADGRFYPDFVCVLPDERLLVVEYKGGDKWSTEKAVADRDIGNLWSSLSNGKCLFTMLKDKEWEVIDAVLS